MKELIGNYNFFNDDHFGIEHQGMRVHHTAKAQDMESLPSYVLTLTLNLLLFIWGNV